MKLRLTLIAALTAGLWCTTPMAQSGDFTYSPNPNKAQNSGMYSQGMWYNGTWYDNRTPEGITYSPNPNKAQNSELRTQRPDGTYYYTPVTPGTTIYYEPSASTRIQPMYVYPSDTIIYYYDLDVPKYPQY